MSRLRSLGVDFPVFVAPMVGISHVAFREWVRTYTPPQLNVRLFTEMLSTRRLPSAQLSTSVHLKTVPGERWLIPQILGNEERFIHASLERLVSRRPWGIDINMGCPVRHTLKHNWGVRLMGDPAYARRVVAMTRKHTSLPLSVKLRASPHDEIDETYLYEFCAGLADAGADWLTIHARTTQQRHKGAVHWDVVARVRERLTVPVVVNGDVQTADCAIDLMRSQRFDGVMVARAATVRPWILAQIAYREGYLCQERPPLNPEEEGAAYFPALARFIEIARQNFDEAHALERSKFLIATGRKWFPFGHAFAVAAARCKTTTELQGFALRYGSTHRVVMQRLASAI